MLESLREAFQVEIDAISPIVRRQALQLLQEGQVFLPGVPVSSRVGTDTKGQRVP
jgi:hypothetical protein